MIMNRPTIYLHFIIHNPYFFEKEKLIMPSIEIICTKKNLQSVVTNIFLNNCNDSLKNQILL